MLADRLLITIADLLTLLLCFFIATLSTHPGQTPSRSEDVVTFQAVNRISWLAGGGGNALAAHRVEGQVRRITVAPHEVSESWLEEVKKTLPPHAEVLIQVGVGERGVQQEALHRVVRSLRDAGVGVLVEQHGGNERSMTIEVFHHG